jgi:hypothetical protein
VAAAAWLVTALKAEWEAGDSFLAGAAAAAERGRGTGRGGGTRGRKA